MQNRVLVSMSLDTLQEEEESLKVGQKMAIYMQSVEFSFENVKEICHDGDNVATNILVDLDDPIHDTPPIKTKPIC
jgi:hypothetical protein